MTRFHACDKVKKSKQLKEKKTQGMHIRQRGEDTAK